MNDRAKCEACRRDRPRHYLRTVTVVNDRGEDQTTLLLACVDSETCHERVANQVKQSTRRTEK